MDSPSSLAGWRRVVIARASPLAVSGVVHALLVGAVLLIGIRATPRWEPLPG